MESFITYLIEQVHDIDSILKYAPRQCDLEEWELTAEQWREGLEEARRILTDENVAAHIAAMPEFPEYSERTGKTAAQVADEAKAYYDQQAPGSWIRNSMYVKIARYMVKHFEPAARAYQEV